MFEWISKNTDLIALSLAVLGTVVSLFTIRMTIQHSRINAYTRMHEALIAPAVARGRRALFQAHARGSLPEVGDPEWDEINQALAMFDTLGVYMRRRIVPTRLTLDAWGPPLLAIREPAEAWMAHRAAHGHQNPWPHLTWLLDRAGRHRMRNPDDHAS